MVHVFLLMLYIGVGDDRRLVSNDMYFRNINTCNYFAKELSKRYSTYAMMDNRDKATAYCLPKYISAGSGIEIYD